MKNTLFTGDNLYIMHGMNSESVDLIYLDPPFNSKRTYSAPKGSKAAGASFKDMWTWKDVDQFYLETLVVKYPALVKFIESIGDIHGKAMMAYVTYMAQRLIEIHRILKPTGTVYLHCDPTASHYLKMTMDEIFGKDNFRNEIVWNRIKAGKTSQHKSMSFGKNTDTILFYSKSNNFNLNPFSELKSEEEILKAFPFKEDGRRYKLDNSHIFRPMGLGSRPNLCYEWRGFKNPNPSGWTMSKERLESEYQKGNFVIKDNGKKLERRKYIEDYKGMPIGNLWSDILPPSAKERTGYPTQKPLALLRRIIEASSNEGDVVFDPFCGCATACVAAQQLGRKWIGIDIEAKAAEVLVERLGDDAGFFKDFIHRTDIPLRTDIKIEPISIPIKARLFKDQNGHCNGCNIEFEIRNFEIDHIVPQSKGGGDYYENYQLLCGNCNRSKGDRPMEYLRMKIAKRQEMLKHQFTFGE